MVAYVLSFIDRQILNLLVGPIRRDLAISDTEMSLLDGLVLRPCSTPLRYPARTHGRQPQPARPDPVRRAGVGAR